MPSVLAIAFGIQAIVVCFGVLWSREERTTATLRLPSLIVALLIAAGSLRSASAGVRLETISLGAGYGYAGPVWPGYDPLVSDPFFYGRALSSSFFPFPVYLVPQPDKGQVSLPSSDKDGEVYLNNAYAGTAAALKKFWIAPGVYELEVRAKNGLPKKKRIYVLTGKTLKVNLE